MKSGESRQKKTLQPRRGGTNLPRIAGPNPTSKDSLSKADLSVLIFSDETVPFGVVAQVVTSGLPVIRSQLVEPLE